MTEKANPLETKELYKAILTLQTPEECEKFFGDLCTVQELKALSQRYHVAVMLKAKKVYNEIVKTTGASTATISRVNRSLAEDDGYDLVLGRLGEQ